MKNGFVGAWDLAGERPKNSKEVLMLALENRLISQSELPKEFQDDRDLILESIKHSPEILGHINKEHLKDKEIVKKAVS